MVKTFTVDNLTVKQYESREVMGAESAAEAIAVIKKLLSEKDHINIVFASAPSQDDFLSNVVKAQGVDWKRVIAYHMDEYVGLASTHPQSFAYYLQEHAFKYIDVENINFIDTTGDPQKQCDSYSKRLASEQIDVVFMGIGENGHIAFNDPDVADFNDPKAVKIVELDDICRKQQVNDKCFPDIDSVPKTAITLTVPTLFSASYLFCVVPGVTKSKAVLSTLEGEISEKCPATIMRRHPNATLYLDPDSASKLTK